MSDQSFEGWAVLEIMGHRRRAGRCVMDDSPTIRIDIPVGDGEEEVTEFYGRAAIFSLRPCSEEVARAAAKSYGDPRPVRPVEFREPDAKPALENHHDYDDDFDDHQDYM